jgi:hypothetical protein
MEINNPLAHKMRIIKKEKSGEGVKGSGALLFIS